MMERPAADRKLDTEIVRTVVRAQFADLLAATVSPLGSGWEHDAYVVDDSVVFRFPRYAGVSRNLDHDVAIHDLVSDAVGDVLRVPKVDRFGVSGDVFPHRFVGHDIVPGVGAEGLAAQAAPRLGADLGRALTRIHAIDPESARAVGVPGLAHDCGAAIAALVEQVRVVPITAVAPGPAAWLAAGPAIPPPDPNPPRFIHNGLHGEHVIIDPETGGLSGIIDWSSAALGDHTIDLAFLLVLGGPEFLETVLADYGLAFDAGVRERTLFRGRVRALGWLVNAVRLGDPLDRILEQVRYVFSV